jgi:hypothetical protein
VFREKKDDNGETVGNNDKGLLDRGVTGKLHIPREDT